MTSFFYFLMFHGSEYGNGERKKVHLVVSVAMDVFDCGRRNNP